MLELNSIESKDTLRNFIIKNSRAVNLSISKFSIEIDRTNLQSGKVVPPKMTSQKRAKVVIGSNNFIELMDNVPPLGILTGNPTPINHFILAHLKMLLTMLGINDA